MARAQLGLAHSYSRAKVKFNVNKADNMIIQVRGVPARLCISEFCGWAGLWVHRLRWPKSNRLELSVPCGCLGMCLTLAGQRFNSNRLLG